MAVIDFFDRGWRQNPKATAYVADRCAWTYQRAGELSCRIANALLAEGLGAGTSGAVLAPNDPAAWICVLGMWRAGMAWVPLNPDHPASEIARLIDGFDCEIVFFHSELEALVGGIRAGLTGVRRWVRIDPDGPPSDWVGEQPGTVPELAYDLSDVVALSPTGGTTGAPKGVMNTHRSLSTAFAHVLMAAHYPAGEPIVNLAAAPMTHTAGTLSMACSARGGTVVVLPRARPDALLEAIEQHRVTELFLPPTVIYRLLERPDIAHRDFSSLRYLIYGAAPMSVRKLRRAVEVFGPVLMGGYGQTEAPLAVSLLRPEEHLIDGRIAGDDRLSSCGRPAPLVTVRIVTDEGTVAEPDQVGEIRVRGDLVMKGYYHDERRTTETLVDGWLHTGDLGFLDDGGYLHITDRKRDVIISGGLNIYPGEIEQVLQSHPAVRDCAVIGVPHEDWGEAVTAVVELLPGASVTPEELTALCRIRLGSVRTPKAVDFLTALPRSAAGKVLKTSIREQYRQPVGRS